MKTRLMLMFVLLIRRAPSAKIRQRQSGHENRSAPRRLLQRATNPRNRFRDCDDCPEMVVILAGESLMGSETMSICDTPSTLVRSPRCMGFIVAVLRG
jgi:hypothetical protein